MSLNVNHKWMIKFDEELKQYIYYRVITKAELEAHLANAQQQELAIQTAITTFQSYIDDPRVPPAEDEEAKA